MSPPADALRARVERLARGLQPELRLAVLTGFEVLVATTPASEIARWMMTVGDVAELIVERVPEAFNRLRQRLQKGLATSFQAFGRDLPGGVGVAFDILNPRVLDALRTLDSRVMRGIADDLRETVRGHLAHGLVEGWGPKKTARLLRDVLPLAPNQAEAVRNFERLLREGNIEALTRKLRDRRFDRTLRKAFAGEGLTEAQISTMTTAYRRRMIAWNAETHARTATLDTLRRGQRLAWMDAAARGVVPIDRLMKERVTVGDSRVREEHALENGQVVGAGEPYMPSNEIIAGENSFNCRCMDRFFIRRPLEAA